MVILDAYTAHSESKIYTGVKSKARQLVLGDIDQPPRQSGFAAYRATVDVEKMKSDSDVLWLLEKPSLNIW